MVFGAPADLLRHHIEVRGLGVLNIQDLFGVTSIRERKRIDVVVRLEDWSENTEYDRLGIEDKWHAILGTPIRLLVVPVRPGRDMGTILEIAARNELLRRAGKASAKEFLARIEGGIVPAEALIPEAPESVAVMTQTVPAQSSPGAPRVGIPRPPRSSWSSLGEHGASNESSAWIPAVRPAKEDE
jgi:HPr kinase/phosphorylase